MALDYVIRYAGSRIHGVLPGDSLAGGTCDLEAGTIGSLTFELPPTHPMARPGAFAVEDPTREVTLSDGDTELFRGWVKKTTLSTDLVLTVECESMLAYLKRTVVRPYSCRQATDLPDGTVILSQDPFEWMVAQHNLHAGEAMAFQVGVNPHVGEVRASTDYKSTWDEMNDAFCTGLDRYLNVRSGPGGERFLDLLDGGAGEGTQYVVLGENVVDMEVAGESGEVVTAIIARGTSEDSAAQAAGDRIERRGFGLDEVANGEVPLDNSLLVIDGDRAINQRLVDAYGIREEKRDYEASNSADLLKMVADDLNPANVAEDGMVNSVVVQAVDLHQLNPRVQPISLLEWDRVFIRAYGLEDDDSAYGVQSGGRLIIDQWLPCSQIHIDIADPSQSTYRFGDLPQTLTRQSALRMGMLRRGNGTLVRRTDGTEWNNDRTWNRTDEVWDHIGEVADDLRDEFGDSLDQWAEHLTDQFGEETSRWYQSLDDAQKENAQGREELLKHLDEVEGKWSDELGRLDGALGDLSSTVDTHHRELLEGIRDAAEGAHRTFYGTCADSGSTKRVNDLTQPGGESFTLGKGSVVEVKMTYASSSACTLNVMSTGARTVMTNGFSLGVWQAGQVVRFVYDGTYWQAASTDIYGATVRVGNPNGSSFYSNGKVAELQIDGTPYWHVGVDGQTVGLTSRGHVDIGSSYVDVIGTSNANSKFRFGYSSTGGATITSTYSCTVESNNGSGSHVFLGPNLTRLHSSSSLLLSSGNNLQTSVWNGTAHNVVMRSVRVSVSNADYVDVNVSSLGISSTDGYAFAITNGDIAAQPVAVIGNSRTSSGRAICVHLKNSISGYLRLNILGFYVGDVSSDQGIEGPEIFGDPEDAGEPPDEEATG